MAFFMPGTAPISGKNGGRPKSPIFSAHFLVDVLRVLGNFGGHSNLRGLYNDTQGLKHAGAQVPFWWISLVFWEILGGRSNLRGLYNDTQGSKYYILIN